MISVAWLAEPSRCWLFEGLGGSPSFASLPLWLWVTLLAPDGALAVGLLLVSRRLRPVHIAHRWHGKASSPLLFVVVTLGIANVQETAIVLGSLASLALIGPIAVSSVREGLRQLSASDSPGEEHRKARLHHVPRVGDDVPRFEPLEAPAEHPLPTQPDARRRRQA